MPSSLSSSRMMWSSLVLCFLSLLCDVVMSSAAPAGYTADLSHTHTNLITSAGGTFLDTNEGYLWTAAAATDSNGFTVPAAPYRIHCSFMLISNNNVQAGVFQFVDATPHNVFAFRIAYPGLQPIIYFVVNGIGQLSFPLPNFSIALNVVTTLIIDVTTTGITIGDGVHTPFTFNYESTISIPSFQATSLILGDTNAANSHGLFVAWDIQSTASVAGDPQFTGYQGQEFQVHGTPGEWFNLMSTPTVQINALFVFLNKGTCHYNNTQCWTHPGTYMSQMALSLVGVDGLHHVMIHAASHEQGLTVTVDDTRMELGDVMTWYESSHDLGVAPTNMTVTHSEYDTVEFTTSLMSFTFINSNMFMNLNTHMHSAIITYGQKKHHITQETQIETMYPNLPIHGLVGQTWRNAVFPSHELYEGTIDDYLTTGPFDTTYKYRYFEEN